MLYSDGLAIGVASGFCIVVTNNLA